MRGGARTVCGGGRGQGAGARTVRGAGRGRKGRERDIGCADGARWRAGTRGGSAISGARTVSDGARWRAGTRGGSAISGARTVRGGGRGEAAGARYRVRGRCAVEGCGGRGHVDKGRERGRCAVEGGDKGRERDIGCADGARTVCGGGRGQGAGARYRVRGRCADGARWRGSAISGAQTVRGGGRGQGAGARYRVCGRCAVEGGDKGRERDIGCADGVRWRAWTRGGSAISGAQWRAWTRGGSADGAQWRVHEDKRTRGGSAISGARTVRGRGRGQGAGARYRVRGRCAVEGVDKGRERDIGCADGARWRAGTRRGVARQHAFRVFGVQRVNTGLGRSRYRVWRGVQKCAAEVPLGARERLRRGGGRRDWVALWCGAGGVAPVGRGARLRAEARHVGGVPSGLWRYGVRRAREKKKLVSLLARSALWMVLGFRVDLALVCLFVCFCLFILFVPISSLLIVSLYVEGFQVSPSGPTPGPRGV